MVVNLLLGLPDQRPGGLALTGLYFVAAGSGALLAGFVYAIVAVRLRRASLPLQAGSAVLRGVPPLLLVFLVAHTSGLPLAAAGLVAILVYSFAHVSEILRSFLASYPRHLSEQARLMAIRPTRELIQLRIPWTLWRGWDAVATHWVSLLKDTGALVVIGIGELTTVAKALSEGPGSYGRWITVLAVAGVLYLVATLVLIQLLNLAVRRIGPPITET